MSPAPAARPRDTVDRIVEQWRVERPDLDHAPVAVIGRISRLSRLIDKRLTESFARFDLEPWMYDVLASLRRAGEPFELYAGDLVRHTMVTTGAITNRIDRLEERGLVQRVAAADRRKVIIRLTPAGRAVVDEVIVAHHATEREILGVLTDGQRRELEGVLRTLLVGLGDADPG
jgi:DNA-binding MarR family transcriptional regulator